MGRGGRPFGCPPLFARIAAEPPPEADRDGDVTLDPAVELRATGLFGRTLLARDLTKVPPELLPGQRVRLTEPWRGAPQFDWGEVTVTASAKGTRESAGRLEKSLGQTSSTSCRTREQ